MILKKKKYIRFKNIELNEKFLNNLKQSKKTKRFEENLRFIANKIFRFLQTAFKTHKFPSLVDGLKPKYQGKSQNAKFAYSFFGYYFQKYAKATGMEIEPFFHPNAQRIKDLDSKSLVPKTVSQHYMKSLRVSPPFINDCLFYLNKIIVYDAEHDIVNKTRKLCQDWETILRENDQEHLLKVMDENFWNNPKFKLPWTVDEVKMAIDQMLKILDSDQSEL